jgi:hypothetical protein
MTINTSEACLHMTGPPFLASIILGKNPFSLSWIYDVAFCRRIKCKMHERSVLSDRRSSRRSNGMQRAAVIELACCNIQALIAGCSLVDDPAPCSPGIAPESKQTFHANSFERQPASAQTRKGREQFT